MKKLIDECPDDLDGEEWEETTETENELVIHRAITENETETNRDTLNKVIKEFPDNLILPTCDDF